MMADPSPQFACLDIAGHDRCIPAPIPGGADRVIQSQLRLPRCLIRPMTFEAAIRENRSDMLAVSNLDRRRGLGWRRKRGRRPLERNHASDDRQRRRTDDDAETRAGYTILSAVHSPTSAATDGDCHLLLSI